MAKTATRTNKPDAGAFSAVGWFGCRLLLTVVLLANAVAGQHTDVVCSSLEWTVNSLGQSPCLVAAYLEKPCSPTGDVNIPTIASDQTYLPVSNPTTCDCSTVTYALLSACAACQGAPVGRWSAFSQNCSQKAPDGQYPLSIPPNTAVPGWAFQPVKGSDQFNVTLGRMQGDAPENRTTTSTDPQHKSHTGVLVGSIVGGVAGMAIIGGLLGYYLTRRNKQREEREKHDFPSAHIPYESVESALPTPSASRFAQYATRRDPSNYGSPSPPYSSYPVTPIPVRPYNPDDPSTFPPPLNSAASFKKEDPSIAV